MPRLFRPPQAKGQPSVWTPINRANPLTKGLVGFWYPVGSRFASAIPGIADATINSTGRLVTQAKGRALAASGTFVQTGTLKNDPRWKPTTGITVLAEGTTPSTSSTFAYWFGCETSNDGFGMYVDSGSTNLLRPYLRVGAAWADQASGIGLGVQAQVGMTFDGTTFWSVANGARANSQAISGTITNSASDLAFTDLQAGGGGLGDGSFYYFAVWNRALTPDELKSFNLNPWQVLRPAMGKDLIAVDGGVLNTITLSASTTAGGARVAAAQAIRAASSAAAATRQQQARAIRSAASSSAGAVQRAVSGNRSASAASSASVVKQARGIRAAATAAVATLTAIKTRLLTLSASAVSGASAQKAVSAAKAASSAAGGVLVKGARAVKSAATAGAATLSVLKARFMTLSASVSASATVVRATQAVRSAAAATAGVLVKRVNSVKSAATAGTAVLASIKAKLLTLSASVAAGGSLVRQARAVRSVVVLASAGLVKRVNAVRSAAATIAGTVQRAVSATRSAASACAVALVKSKVKLLTLSASVAQAASVAKAARITRGAATGAAAFVEMVGGSAARVLGSLIGRTREAFGIRSSVQTATRKNEQSSKR